MTIIGEHETMLSFFENEKWHKLGCYASPSQILFIAKPILFDLGKFE
jgi:hypothetical protein